MAFRLLPTVVLTLCWCATVAAAEPHASAKPTLDDIRTEGAKRSRYRGQKKPVEIADAPTANLDQFRKQIRPLLENTCFGCHGENEQEGNVRIDALDPDLIDGKDTNWWLEVFQAVSSGEMPPSGEPQLKDRERSQIVDWLSSELQVASQVASDRQAQSSFRRFTRYELNHALQDLLGLPYDFTQDLPPEPTSKDGFLNNAAMLQISASQFDTIRQISRDALRKAIASGPRPDPIYYAVTMDFGIEKLRERRQEEIKNLRNRFADDPDRLQKEIEKRTRDRPKGARYENLDSGIAVAAKWQYGQARFARTPTAKKPATPDPLPDVAVIPRGQRIVLDLGDHLPMEGNLLLRIRAGIRAERPEHVGTFRVHFGHQASNNSQAEQRIGTTDIAVTAPADAPHFYEVEIPLGEVVRNPFLGVQSLGETPNPAEFVKLFNTSIAPVDLQIDYVDVTAPHHVAWPPESHRRVFANGEFKGSDAEVQALLSRFIERAWRRPPTRQELDQKQRLFRRLRPHCESDQEAMVEVLSVVLSSPKFFYLPAATGDDDLHGLASRLAAFLWSSLPDQRLLDLAESGRLAEPSVLSEETDRMLDDPRAKRFANQFVRQWLGMELLERLQMSESLRDAMMREPIEFFSELLRQNHSVLDFLHSDYTMVNERLALHYGLKDVHGPEFRRVELPQDMPRGGLLTQAGLLAMNSDGEDSHPLKRGIWLLERILNDPPPPPPPAVPEIDLSDPKILELTLKERMEDHRNDPACMSCHQRIDPWGIAFENYDAMGSWRTRVGDKPVDSVSVLDNQQTLDGVLGLKKYLLGERQDQFVRAITHKVTSYALGRPVGFGDHRDIESIVAQLRQRGDGLRTLIHLIVNSERFRSQPTDVGEN